MNDDRASGALARGALIFICPSSVVETRFAREQLRIPIGIVVQHEQHLAFEILTLEVIPIVFGRFDAVAHEHDLGVLNRPALGLHAARGDVLVPPIESEGFAVAPEGPLLRHLRSDADDIEELLPLALLPGRFETDLLELLDEIPPRLLIARSRRSAALELVGGKF